LLDGTLLMGMVIGDFPVFTECATQCFPKCEALAQREPERSSVGAVFLNGFLTNGCAGDPARTTDSGAKNGAELRETS
jgi:hypothetical protein